MVKDMFVDSTDYMNGFLLTFKSPIGCRSEPPFIFIILVILVSSLVLYFFVGILINVYKNKLSGSEAIPHVEFWSSLPENIKEGILFVKNKCRKE